MRTDRYDVAIIGGGIVGLAVAFSLSRSCPRLSVVVLEKEAKLASHQSGHNSGVIHSGIYYRPGSLKARLTVEGAQALVDFCKDQGLAVKVTGKLIVAKNDSEVDLLKTLSDRGRTNGVRVEWLDRHEMLKHEAHVAGIAALRVLETAVCDFTEVSNKYAQLFNEAGGEVRLRSEVVALRDERGRVVITTPHDELQARYLVNCAGLQSDRIASLDGVHSPVRIVPFRGQYYEIAGQRQDLVNGLIYPVPKPAFPFLGVHLTRTIDDRIKVGPNAIFTLSREHYGRRFINLRDAKDAIAHAGLWRLARDHWRTGMSEWSRAFSKRAFTKAAQSLVPDLEQADLKPAETGIRAQAVTERGELVDDFLIEQRRGRLHVLNAPSPAATASLPIGMELSRRILEEL